MAISGARKGRAWSRRPAGKRARFGMTPLQIVAFALVFGALGIGLTRLGHVAPIPARYWIMTHKALDYVVADPGAKAALANDTIYASGINPNALTPAESGLHIVPIMIVQSEAAIAQDMANNSIPSYDKAVLYDNEPWDLTPQNEKDDPVGYYQEAGNLLHTHGLKLIATPVPNSYAPKVARYADVVDVQAQYAQASVSKYLGTVKTDAVNAGKAPNHPVVLTGISTNPSAGDPTPQQLLSIAQATFPGIAQGWWLNIPAPGTACPKCNAARPDIAISFLKLLGVNGTVPKPSPPPKKPTPESTSKTPTPAEGQSSPGSTPSTNHGTGNHSSSTTNTAASGSNPQTQSAPGKSATIQPTEKAKHGILVTVAAITAWAAFGGALAVAGFMAYRIVKQRRQL